MEFYISEDDILHSHRRENTKCYSCTFTLQDLVAVTTLCEILMYAWKRVCIQNYIAEGDAAVRRSDFNGHLWPQFRLRPVSSFALACSLRESGFHRITNARSL
jgi:hypothetical protein